MILNYQEKANRDRFILPYNEDISYFIDIDFFEKLTKHLKSLFIIYFK